MLAELLAPLSKAKLSDPAAEQISETLRRYRLNRHIVADWRDGLLTDAHVSNYLALDDSSPAFIEAHGQILLRAKMLTAHTATECLDRLLVMCNLFAETDQAYTMMYFFPWPNLLRRYNAISRAATPAYMVHFLRTLTDCVFTLRGRLTKAEIAEWTTPLQECICSAIVRSAGNAKLLGSLTYICNTLCRCAKHVPVSFALWQYLVLIPSTVPSLLGEVIQTLATVAQYEENFDFFEFNFTAVHDLLRLGLANGRTARVYHGVLRLAHNIREDTTQRHLQSQVMVTALDGIVGALRKLPLAQESKTARINLQLYAEVCRRNVPVHTEFLWDSDNDDSEEITLTDYEDDNHDMGEMVEGAAAKEIAHAQYHNRITLAIDSIEKGTDQALGSTVAIPDNSRHNCRRVNSEYSTLSIEFDAATDSDSDRFADSSDTSDETGNNNGSSDSDNTTDSKGSTSSSSDCDSARSTSSCSDCDSARSTSSCSDCDSASSSSSSCSDSDSTSSSGPYDDARYPANNSNTDGDDNEKSATFNAGENNLGYRDIASQANLREGNLPRGILRDPRKNLTVTRTCNPIAHNSYLAYTSGNLPDTDHFRKISHQQSRCDTDSLTTKQKS